MGADERALVAAFVARRDETTFLALYRLCTPRLHLLALRLTGGRAADAEDILQDAWIRACEGMTGFRGESALQTWLSGILVNCWREMRREVRDTVELDDAAHELSAPPADGGLENLIRALPRRCREVLILHDLEGHTHDEIAKALDIAVGTSKHHLFRARQILRRWLGSVKE